MTTERKFIPNSDIERAVQCAVRSISRRKDVGAISEDDLFQEGMVFALNHMDEYCDDKATVMTFLFRPVKTHLNRIIQREVQSSGMLLPETEEDIEELAAASASYPDVAKAFSYESDLALQFDIKELLETLGAEERDIITERFMNGVKLKDLATRYCISEPAMHHRIADIIGKLRIRLGDEYETG